MELTNITNISCSALENIDGTLHRKAYMNTKEGRAEFMEECFGAENYNEVLEAWGDGTADIPLPPHTGEPTQEERITALEAQLAAYEAAYAEGVNEA